MAAAAWEQMPLHNTRAGEPTEASDKVNILMVDDQPAKLLSYEVILAELGENLIKATSARQALEHLLKKDIAVVLTDVSMPDMNGFDLAEMIRQHPRFQRTAIIFISGVHLSDVDRVKAYQQGAVDYITVPVVPELLRAKVSIFAELHRKRRQLEILNHELEQRVAERTEELRERADLLDLATEAIMVRDLEGRVQFWNTGAEELLGWRRAEVVGRHIRETVQSRQYDCEGDSAEALLRTGRLDGNLVQYTRDGNEIVVASRQAVKTNADGIATSILEINRDITATLQTEEALRKAERLAAMGRVAGIIAHEINNPLEAIINAFYLLRDHPSLDEEARGYARLGEEELHRIAHIVRQTLGFYRDSQKATQVSVATVLDEVVELQVRHLHVNRITVEKRYDCDAFVYGFPVEIRQVFLNLISNAVQAMPEGGCLRLRISQHIDPVSKARGISVFLGDTGSGITPEDARRLFEPFFSTKSAKGTGLGLWISKGIIQKYDGTIHFRSIRTSRGGATSFRIFFPEQASSTRPTPGSSDASTRAGGGVHA
jgi:PAS domain S-box-containing protein